MTCITDQLTVAELFENCEKTCSLQWAAGKKGDAQLIVAEENKARVNKKSSAKKKRARQNTENRSLVGHLSLIYPHQIQIIGSTALSFLKRLNTNNRQNSMEQLFASKPICIIVSHDNRIPAFLKKLCDNHRVPLFQSSIASNILTEHLRYYLGTLFADVLTLHGVYLDIHTIGALITGPSGVGKSELALELIARGHHLVADDAPQFTRLPSGKINGGCPAILQDFIEVRGMGIINIRKLFGDIAIKHNKELGLIIKLAPSGSDHIQQIDRLAGSYTTENILDTPIPEITLPVALGRNLAVLLECAVRNHILRTSGYNAHEEFADRQQHALQPTNIQL